MMPTSEYQSCELSLQLPKVLTKRKPQRYSVFAATGQQVLPITLQGFHVQECRVRTSWDPTLGDPAQSHNCPKLLGLGLGLAVQVWKLPGKHGSYTGSHRPCARRAATENVPKDTASFSSRRCVETFTGTLAIPISLPHLVRVPKITLSLRNPQTLDLFLGVGCRYASASNHLPDLQANWMYSIRVYCALSSTKYPKAKHMSPRPWTTVSNLLQVGSGPKTCGIVVLKFCQLADFPLSLSKFCWGGQGSMDISSRIGLCF